VTLFLDVGTNGETVLGDRDWLVTCACSAGPAFEGAGVVNGMRATQGAIEEVWINSDTLEPTYRVIGGGKPKGICGSGLISLLSEAFITGVIDKAGNVKLDAPSFEGPRRSAWRGVCRGLGRGDRVGRGHRHHPRRHRQPAARQSRHLCRLSRCWRRTSASRSKPRTRFWSAVRLENTSTWKRRCRSGCCPIWIGRGLSFLGNTSVKGAYLALLDWRKRERITEIAKRMTYIELSADNSFYDAFTSALFLPHTDLSKFPSVAEALSSKVEGRTTVDL
jgi:uncharacterized 2Fe-2S/4Fe-4S cluster protein (DUF4445 family)